MDWKSLFVFDWRVVLSLAAIAVAAAYIRYKILFGHWKRRGIPEIHPKPVPFFGHAASLILFSRSFTEFFDHLYKSAAGERFVGYFHGAQPSIVVRDPELLKHIFVKDFHAFVDRGFSVDEDIDPLNAKGLFSLKGQRWKEMRARLSPTFTSGRMKAMFPIMQACAEQLYKSFSKNIEKSGGEAIVEVKEYMACYSTDVIATCAFGIHCDSLENPQTNEFRRMGKLVFEVTLKRRIISMIFFISPKLMKWAGLKFTDDETSTFFRNFIKDMVKQREKAIEQSEKNGKTEKKYEDFIHHLVMLKKSGFHFKDDDDAEVEENEHDRLEQNKLNDKPEEASWSSLDNEDLTAQVMLFFSAGFETTSATLSFALFELSASESGRAIQEKLREEVDRVVTEDDGKLTYAGLQRMLLLDRVIKETLRIYPPAGVLGRKAEQDYKVPGTNLIIDAGTQLFIPIYSLQLDEKYFPNPTVFDPDRFLPENKENVQNFSYLPFGDGPRICIGERFALMQIKLGLATLLSKLKFEVCREKTDIPLKFQKTAFLLTAEQGIWLKVRPR